MRISHPRSTPTTGTWEVQRTTITNGSKSARAEVAAAHTSRRDDVRTGAGPMIGEDLSEGTQRSRHLRRET